MKLKAPPGVGDPCVAGVLVTACDGLYEVEAEIGALLVEAFGFVAVAAPDKPKVPSLARTAPQRRRPPRTKEAQNI